MEEETWRKVLSEVREIKEGIWKILQKMEEIEEGENDEDEFEIDDYTGPSKSKARISRD